MLKRWGKPWYYIGIGGNLGFIILYVITLLPGNPVTGRGGNVDITAAICARLMTCLIKFSPISSTKEIHGTNQLGAVHLVWDWAKTPS